MSATRTTPITISAEVKIEKPVTVETADVTSSSAG